MSTPQLKDGFCVEDRGDLTVLQIPHKQEVFGLDQTLVHWLQAELERVRQKHTKVLLVNVPADNLSPASVDAFRAKASTEKPLRSFSIVDDGRPVSLRRADYAITQLLHTIHTLDTFVVVSFDGEIDFDLFGLLLGCDYRICSDETLFVNRVLDVGVAPGTGVLWFLSRYLGYAQAHHLMVEGKSLSAQEANELKLVDRVVSREYLNSEALLSAERFAKKPGAALHSLAHAADYLDHDFNTYLKSIGSGFGELPPEARR